MKPKVKKVYAVKAKAKNKCKREFPFINDNDSTKAICLLPLHTTDKLVVSSEGMKDLMNNFDRTVFTKVQANDSYLVGDVFWSKIPGHNWWPSMISYDPNTAVFCQTMRNSVKYHVQFFGDVPTRGWVSKTNLMDFSGLDAFLSLPNRLASLKFSNSSLKESWDHAVIQAESALSLDRKQRKLICTYSYQDNLPGTANIKLSKKEKLPKKITSQKSSQERKPSVKTNTGTNHESRLVFNSETEKDGNCFGKSLNDNCLGNDSLKVILKEVPLNLLSASCIPREFESDNEMNIIEVKRTRKKKIFEDFHTGSDLFQGSEKKFKNKKIKKSEQLEIVAPIGQQEKENLVSEELKKDSSYKIIKNEPIGMSSSKNSTKTSQENYKCNIYTNKTSDKKCHISLKNIQKNCTSKEKDNLDLSLSQTGISKKRKLTSIKPIESNSKKKKIDSSLSKTVPTLTSALEITQVKLDPDLSDVWPNLKKDLYCCICEGSEGTLITCNGSCFNSFHFDCLGVSCSKPNFTCDECLTNNHCCFLCKSPGAVIKCSHNMCGRYYHQHCLLKIPVIKSQFQENTKAFSCPLHSCSFCSEKSNKSPLNKLIKCIRCPTAYHQSSCLVAGCTIITNNNMICDCHFQPQKNNTQHLGVNVTWCFVCSQGGSLVCCDTCPASFHVECYEDLNEVPENSWHCNDCLQRKKPRYNDIVWVKYGVYRWWPAKVCIPSEIPEKILNLPHVIGQFPVMFFGSKDYSWVHSGRVFKYQDGDKGGNAAGKLSASLANYFKNAIEEAKEAFIELEKQRAILSDILGKKKLYKPPPFKAIKSNRPVSCIRNILDQSEWPICECSKESLCSSESECLNRMLLFECSAKTCPAGDSCQNQQMQRNEYKKCHPFKSEGRGWGLMADAEIKCGEFVIEYVGELIDEETCHKRVREYHEKDISDYYFLTIDKDNIIDAYPKGNMSRFMNHSCNPNCETQKWTVNGEIRVGLFATKDISVGEELCFNYNLDSLGNDKKQCKCGAANCSGFLGVPPKTQHSIAVAEKGKLKKDRKKIKKQQRFVHDDDCFVCGDGGELIMCSRNKCTKTYHVECLKLEKRPYGRWECPWHYCDVCGKLAKSMCVLCPNSYCGKHSENEILLINEVSFCVDHEEEEVAMFCASIDENAKAKPDFSVVVACDLKKKDMANQLTVINGADKILEDRKKKSSKKRTKKETTSTSNIKNLNGCKISGFKKLSKKIKKPLKKTEVKSRKK